jgi:uncharacterized membrane protein
MTDRCEHFADRLDVAPRNLKWVIVDGLSGAVAWFGFIRD